MNFKQTINLDPNFLICTRYKVIHSRLTTGNRNSTLTFTFVHLLRPTGDATRPLCIIVAPSAEQVLRILRNIAVYADVGYRAVYSILVRDCS